MFPQCIFPPLFCGSIEPAELSRKEAGKRRLKNTLLPSFKEICAELDAKKGVTHAFIQTAMAVKFILTAGKRETLAIFLTFTDHHIDLKLTKHFAFKTFVVDVGP